MRNYLRRPRSGASGFNARDVARAYNCPVDQADGSGQLIGIIELGGALTLSDLSAMGLPTTNVTVVPVAGGAPRSDGPDGADGEVALDVEVALQVAPGARIRVYFCPNSDSGFVAAITQARRDGCGAISVSWGSAESEWEAASVKAFETEFAACRAVGIPVFVAAGDSGADDGTRSSVTDYPASSPNTVGCGGTRLVTNPDGSRHAETVWDDNPRSSATGGGVSKLFPGRTVPDIAGNADPSSGYLIEVDGQRTVIGGTSAVAPLMAACFAVVKQLIGSTPFDFLNVIAANPSICFDVVTGNNGSFRATIGRDDVSGWGVPDFGKLLAVLQAAPTPTPTPVPTPTPAPVPTDGAVSLLTSIESQIQTFLAGPGGKS